MQMTQSPSAHLEEHVKPLAGPQISGSLVLPKV